MICPKCLSENPDGALYCNKCANRLFSPAQHYVKDSKDSNDYSEREKKIEPVAGPEPQKAKRETERRQATVMFTEITGYSELVGSLGAKEAIVVMNRCFGLFDNLRKKYNGWTDRLTNNCLVTYFGVPTATENAPTKAINAAIEFRNALHHLTVDQMIPEILDVRMGISTGTVITGEIGGAGKKEYSVVGNTVNFASRLKDLAGPGQIYVGSKAHRHTKYTFDYTQLKPMPIEGTSKPATVYELRSERYRIHRESLTSERTIHAELVGREREMDKLEFQVLKAINNEGSIVNMIGEAGVGKSRLIAELINKEFMKKVTFLRGRALSIGSVKRTPHRFHHKSCSER